jgi:hypothetical protein
MNFLKHGDTEAQRHEEEKKLLYFFVPPSLSAFVFQNSKILIFISLNMAI